MDAEMIPLIVTGAIAGFAGGVINLYLWYLTLTKKKIFGRDVHAGFASSIKKTLDEIPEHLDKKNIRKIEERILEIFDAFMSKKLIEKMPVLSMFIDEALITEIRVIFKHEMEVHLPNILKNSLTTEKNIIMVISMITKSIAKSLKKYRVHALLFLLAGTFAGAMIGLVAGFLF